MKTAEEILEENFNKAVEKYPNENWVKDFKSQEIELEFICNAMKDYARIQIEKDRERVANDLPEELYADDNTYEAIGGYIRSKPIILD